MDSKNELTMNEKEISQAVIARLPRYLRFLGELKDAGVERISSRDLSIRMKTSASQIRQDLHHFGGFGQQGYGYNVRFLYEEIAKILGLDHTHHLIIIGAGNLGSAIANYGNFERRGFLFEGIFDQNKALQGKVIHNMVVQPMEELEEFIKNHNTDIAVLTIPKNGAVEVADQLVHYGIKAIWNFANVDLNVPENITVENVHLSDSLMKLSYKLYN